jgi:hypothetical protein
MVKSNHRCEKSAQKLSANEKRHRQINGSAVYVQLAPLGLGTTRIMTSEYITVVPVPAAIWLLGSALAGLGWFRRKTA